jgi:two-component system sensor histidine kinase AgrC
MEKDLIRNHENKNHLIVIKNMVPKNNKKLIQYINSIMSELIEVEDAWLVKLKNIPRGGLQGLIYYKISQIKKESINLSLDISQNLKKTYFSKLDTENNRDLCTILGVYLDNAIDAAKQSDKKQIGIEIYPYQDVIRIAISNTYRGTLDINKFYNYGYTTKGVGRGYGLALVKSIVEKNKHFNEHREVINDYYIKRIPIGILLIFIILLNFLAFLAHQLTTKNMRLMLHLQLEDPLLLMPAHIISSFKPLLLLQIC